jgi:hypothetical protein
MIPKSHLSCEQTAQKFHLATCKLHIITIHICPDNGLTFYLPSDPLDSYNND